MTRFLRWLLGLPKIGPTPEQEQRLRQLEAEIAERHRNVPPPRELTDRPCGYCGREPPYFGWNDGVCRECAAAISRRLSGGLQIPWGT